MTFEEFVRTRTTFFGEGEGEEFHVPFRYSEKQYGHSELLVKGALSFLLTSAGHKIRFVEPEWEEMDDRPGKWGILKVYEDKEDRSDGKGGE